MSPTLAVSRSQPPHGGHLALLAVALVTSWLAPPAAVAKVTTLNEAFDAPGTVATGDGWVVATQARSHAQLYVGRLGREAQQVTTAPPMPWWSQPHVGTDRTGRTVIVFPSCAHGNCDLQMLDPTSGAIESVPGGSRPGVNEVEGDLDRGALALIAARPGHPLSTQMRLVYRPALGKPVTLNRRGGEKIELDRGRILTLRVDGDAPRDGCGTRVIDLTTTAGRTTTVARVACHDGTTVQGLGFIGRRRVAWAVGEPGVSTFWQRDLKASAAQSVRSLHQFISFAPVNSRRALVIGGDFDYAAGPPSNPNADFEPEFPLYDITGIQVGAPNARGQLPDPGFDHPELTQ